MSKSKEKKSTLPVESATVNLADAQAQAKADRASRQSGLTEIIVALLHEGLGKPVPVEQIAAAVGPATTRADVRHTFQRAGLSSRKNDLIETPDGKNWIWLSKVKGQNCYLIDKPGVSHAKAKAQG